MVCFHIIKRSESIFVMFLSKEFIHKLNGKEVGRSLGNFYFVINPRLALTFLHLMIPHHKKKHL